MSLETIVIMSCVLTAITWLILFAFVAVLLRYGTQGVTSLLGRAFGGDGIGGMFGGDDEKNPQQPARATAQNAPSGSSLRNRASNLDFPAPDASGAAFAAQSAQGNFGTPPPISSDRFGSTLGQQAAGTSGFGAQSAPNQTGGFAPQQPNLGNPPQGNFGSSLQVPQQGFQQNQPSQPSMPSLSPSRPFSGDPMQRNQGAPQQGRYGDSLQRPQAPNQGFNAQAQQPQYGNQQQRPQAPNQGFNAPPQQPQQNYGDSLRPPQRPSGSPPPLQQNFGNQSNQFGDSLQPPQRPSGNQSSTGSPLPPRPQDNPPGQNRGNPNPPLQNRLQQQHNQQPPPPNDNQMTQYRPGLRGDAGAGFNTTQGGGLRSGRDNRRGDDRDEIYDDGGGFFD